jgi:hypothetical protein
MGQKTSKSQKVKGTALQGDQIKDEFVKYIKKAQIRNEH